MRENNSQELAAFSQKLKDSVESLMDSYMEILRASKIEGRESAEREKLQLTTHAAGIVGEAQTLLKMITELKMSVLTSNLEDLNRTVNERTEMFRQSKTAAVQQTKQLEDDIDAAIHELETHYYSSVYR